MRAKARRVYENRTPSRSASGDLRRGSAVAHAPPALRPCGQLFIRGRSLPGRRVGAFIVLTKFAVEGITEALAKELAPLLGIFATVALNPAILRTNFLTAPPWHRAGKVIIEDYRGNLRRHAQPGHAGQLPATGGSAGKPRCGHRPLGRFAEAPVHLPLGNDGR